MRLLSGKFCSLEKLRAKRHPDGRHFFKFLNENSLKIKTKPNPDNFTVNFVCKQGNYLQASPISLGYAINRGVALLATSIGTQSAHRGNVYTVV
jgi:hypothetical protein